MKSSVLLFFFLFHNSLFCQSQIKNDLLKEKIKGHVRSIIESEYLGNNGVIDNRLSFRKIRDYNTNGNLIAEKYYEDTTIKATDTIKYDNHGEKLECQSYSYYFKTLEKTTYIYDKDKSQLLEKCYMEDGKLNRTNVYKYNIKGNLISLVIVSSDEIVRGKFEYKYDSSNYKIEENTYSGNELLSRKAIYKNDDYGNEIEILVCDANGKIDFKRTCKYEGYDKHGNWLVKIIYKENKPQQKIIRDIKYW